VKVLLRLFRYVKHCKGEALLSFALAWVVALLAFAQFPTIIAVVKVLFGGGEDNRDILAFVDKFHWPASLMFVRDFLAWLISDYIVQHPLATLVYALVIFIALNFLKGVAAFYQEYTAGKVHTSVSRRVAADLYEHVLGLSMSFYNRVGSPNIVSRFTNDVEALGRGVAMLFGKVLVEPLLIVVYFIVALAISWKLLLFNLALFPILAIGIRMLGLKSGRAMRKGLYGRDRLLSILQETFEGIPIVKVFNMEGREKERFAVENETVRKQDLKLAKADAFVSPFVEFVGVLAAAVSLIYAGRMVINGEMTGTLMMGFYYALASMSGPIRKLSNVNNRVHTLIEATRRVFEFLDEEPDVAEKEDAAELGAFSREIRFENVSFSYIGGEDVLSDVSLAASKGEIVALVGPSGAGKTTIARLVPRFYDPRAGRVTIDGTDLREVTLASLRDQIGMVTQEVILFNDTIAANIAYGRPGASKNEIERAARSANAGDFIEKLPNGYDSIIGEKGLVLSGGQRQRIALARAILKDPPVLILDEATSSLDSESEHLIQQSLDTFMEHRTSIVIAHRLSTVERASRIYFVDAGRVVASGTNEELLANCQPYRNLYRRQFRLAEA
jgi:subfamily B ATP-binding cassette protein MsbA